MSHGHLVEETDFFSHCYPKDKGEHKETEGLRTSEFSKQKAKSFSLSLPLTHQAFPTLIFFSSAAKSFFFFFFFVSKNSAALKRQRERERVREAEWKKKAKEKCTSKLWSGAELFASWKTKPLNPFPEANSESIHVAIYLSLSLYLFLRLQLIFSLAALL